MQAIAKTPVSVMNPASVVFLTPYRTDARDVNFLSQPKEVDL